eukprot:gnl/TRDRNA2_/TRDRNA2_137084_c0_seq1.p1 gnl/TRDRNA2_/TRDRNA2_137084_c0~~gnl/TRDRNA2_/TRDRNA2_137084_c0_seq1.p1  ORF type:complete len:550 (+),score=66.05 gnl/TRDRNA2_/TRDRNA2_137084_c0_seq1:75-1724(+)
MSAVSSVGVEMELPETSNIVTGSFTAHHRDGDAEVDVDLDDDGVRESAVDDPDAPLHFRFSWRKLFRFMGPGWLMSLAYLDPGNLEADLQMGAYTGFHILWVLWWATVMGLILQTLSARLGVVTGKDLAQNIRSHYPSWLNYTVYVNMEIAVIASDIQEVVGSGIALNLLTGLPVWIGCIITGLDTFTFLAVHYLGVRYLEALICVLIGTMTMCFFVNWGESGTDAGTMVTGWLLPSVHTYAVTQAVGSIGAVIMPHNLYLHSGLVLTRKIDRSCPRKVNEAIWYNFIESALALLVSFFVNLSIVATNASKFFDSTCAEDPNGPYACLSPEVFSGATANAVACVLPLTDNKPGLCGELGLQSEGAALEQGLGKAALYIWAIGLLASGQAATMTATYAGQIIMGGCLRIELAPWKRVALTRAIALGPSILVAAGTFGDSNFFNTLNEFLNVLQSVQLPFAMLPLLSFTAQKHVLDRFRSTTAMIFVNFCLASLVMVANAFLIAQWAEGFSTNALVVLFIYLALYLFVLVAMVNPSVQARHSSRQAQRTLL